MIRATVAVAAVVHSRAERAEFARDARWARLAAFVLDGLLLSLVYAAANGVFGMTVVTSGFIGDSGGVYTTTTTVPWQWLSLVGFAYFLAFEAMFGATPGKQLMRIKVVRLDGAPLGVRALVVRNVLRVIDFLPVAYLLGGVLVLMTPRPAALRRRGRGHDHRLSPPRARSARRGRRAAAKLGLVARGLPNRLLDANPGMHGHDHARVAGPGLAVDPGGDPLPF